MFEQSVVEVRGLAARPWTLAASLTAQVALVSVALLIPLVHPEVLQHVALWVPVGAPHGMIRDRGPKRVDAARAVTSRKSVDTNAFVAPRFVPKTLSTLPDEPPAAVEGAVIADGVPGGTNFGDSVSPLIRSIEVLPPIKPATVPTAVKTTVAPPPVSRVRTGGEVQAALLVFGPRPVYPPLAKQARIAGTVHLAAVIGADGRILNLRAMDGHPLLVGAAIAAVKQWVYRPTLLNGNPVEVITEITVTFTLQ